MTLIQTANLVSKAHSVARPTWCSIHITTDDQFWFSDMRHGMRNAYHDIEGMTEELLIAAWTSFLNWGA